MLNIWVGQNPWAPARRLRGAKINISKLEKMFKSWKWVVENKDDTFKVIKIRWQQIGLRWNFPWRLSRIWDLITHFNDLVNDFASLLFEIFFVNDVRKKAVFSSIIWTNLRYARLWDPRLWFQGFISRTCTKATLLREAWLLELVSFLIIFQFNLIALSASPVWFVWLLFLLQKSGSTTNKCLYL